MSAQQKLSELVEAATVPCDLCEWPMAIPEPCAQSGEILGLLICSQCAEDQLQSEVIQ